MNKITPHLWFDKEAKEATSFYVSVFGKNSKVTNTTTITGTPSGDCDIVYFDLWGQSFVAISAGPYFKPTPALSFMVNFDPSQDPEAAKRIDEIWAKLSEGGNVVMELGEYPFSKRYGWVQDKYGFSWQLIFTNPEGEERPLITPAMLFVNEKCGKAEEASDFYLSVFRNSPSKDSGQAKRGALVTYPAGSEPNKEGSVMFTDFMLEKQWFAAMDGGGTHNFDFNEAVSLIINCENQAEIDYYWEKLSAVPESEQCGWLKDKYGVSWQIVPAAMNDMMTKGSKEQIVRVTTAFLKMKRFVIADLKKAYTG